MTLKLYIIDQIAGILQSGVSISKMEDRKAKRDLMDDYIALRKLGAPETITATKALTISKIH